MSAAESETAKETRAERLEREQAERAAQVESDARTLLKYPAADRRAHAAAQGWPDSRIKRALEAARILDPAPPKKVVKLVPKPSDGREQILITANTHEVTEAMKRAISGAPGLYHRGCKLVQVVASEGVTDGETVVVAQGTPQTRELPLSTLIDVVSARTMCMSFDARTSRYVHKAPPKDRVRAVLEAGEWAGVPELVGVIETPSMRPDGSLIQTPGYDARTRFLYRPSEPFDLVPEKPSQEQARKAREALEEVYIDFPYVNAAHRSAAIAMAVTLVARPAIDGAVPCWLFDASVRRSGKTKQVDAACTLATGRSAGRSIFPHAKNVDELAKVMAGHALAGTPLILFDNVPPSQLFAGPVLDAWITAEGRTNFRVLGKTGDHDVEWRSVIAATGNGIECGDDLAPRCLAPRLESPLENPELRADFKHDPLLPWVKANRARLVVAILTILRGYVVAGRPDMKIPRWGSFEAWTGLIASALGWAGADDPTGARKASGAADDPQLAAERVLVQRWKGECLEDGKDSMTAAQFIAHVYAPRKAGVESPQDITPLREALEFLTHTKPGHAPEAKALARVLRALKHRNVQGQRLAVAGETGGVVRWKTERVTS